MSNALTTTQGFDLSPTNMKEALEFSKLLADSALVPKDYQGKPGNVLVAVQWGMELGLKPMQAMQNIAVINGRPSVWGDAVLALVLSSSVCEDVQEYMEGDGDKLVAHCIAKRKGRADVHQTFSMLDARQAGLLGKQGPWTQYPRRMLQMRARGFALRDQFADVLKGMPIAEEEMGTERDITPQPAQHATPGSRTESVKSKLGITSQPAETLPTLADIAKRLQAAATPNDMAAIKADGARLESEADKDEAGKLYLARLAELKKASKAQPQPQDDGPTFEEVLALVNRGQVTEARDMARGLSESDQAAIEKAIEDRA